MHTWIHKCFSADDFKQVSGQLFKWDFEGIIPCHGDVVFSGAKDMIREQLLGPKAAQA